MTTSLFCAFEVSPHTRSVDDYLPHQAIPAEYTMVIMILFSWKDDPDIAIQHSSVTLISRDQRVAVSKGKISQSGNSRMELDWW
jgi:hypothetical protein